MGITCQTLGLSRSSVADSSDLLDPDVLSLESSDSADSMLLAPSRKEEADVVVDAEDSICTESCPAPHTGNCSTSCLVCDSNFLRFNGNTINSEVNLQQSEGTTQIGSGLGCEKREFARRLY